MLVPFFILLVFGHTIFSGVAALTLFVAAAVSDYLDGLFARKLGLHSVFGEFLDPLADKLLVGSAFISFALLPELHIPIWLVAIILLREFFVTILRIAAIKRSVPMKTERLGKIKTAFQMITIIAILFLLMIDRVSTGSVFFSGGPTVRLVCPLRILFSNSGPNTFIRVLPLILVSVSALLAFISMVQYIIKNHALLTISR